MALDELGAAFFNDECAQPTNYCTTAPNSVGTGAIIGYQGSLSIGDDNFRLYATDCPRNQFAIFYFGPTQIEFPFGEGFRCIGGMPHRLPIVQTGSTGVPTFLVDYGVFPTSLLTPYSSWNLQCWYSDPAGGGTGFNLSNGYEVVWLP